MMEKRHRRYPERSDVSIIGVLEGGKENRAEAIFEDLMTGPVSLRKDKENVRSNIMVKPVISYLQSGIGLFKEF